MVGVGIVGLGFMGMTHFHAISRLRGARVAAICTRDAAKRAGDWRGIRGNFGPSGERVDLSHVHTHARIESLLADETVDLVDICLPTAMHSAVSVAALDAGKHLLVEKPIALSVADARAMLAAARRAGRLLMVAHVLPFVPEYAFVRKAVAGNRYGRLLGARFERIICPPAWWKSADLARSGGPAIDLHIHDAHFVSLLCGRPKRVSSRGVLRDGIVRHIDTQYDFGRGGPCVTCSGGALAQPARPFTHRFEIHFERATLTYAFATLRGQGVPITPLTVLSATGRAHRPRLQGRDTTDAFAAELRAAVGAVRSGREPEMLSGRIATEALRLCLKEIDSAKAGRVVRVGSPGRTAPRRNG